MAVDIVFICDRCGCSDHVNGFEPSMLLSRYIPTGWNCTYRAARGHWFCEACSRVGDA